MDLSEFNKSWFELKVDLNSWLERRITTFKFLLRENYDCYQIEISHIISRIEKELKIFNITEKEFLNLQEKNMKTLENLSIKSYKNLMLFILDFKSFFVFTQIFLDTLARIIRSTYGKKGKQLPQNMTALLRSKKAMELDADFFDKLRKKMAWYGIFNDRRDSIVHWLGNVRTTPSLKDDVEFDVLKFDIHAKEQRKLWEINAVNSALDYIEETMGNLSRVILCIHEKSKHFRSNDN